MRVLGIETSCDETAAAVVSRDAAGRPQLLSNTVLSQINEHAAFGGVVPEIAARSHLSALDGIIEAALHDSNSSLTDINAIAVTAGPGLIGGLLVGLMTAKGLAAATGKPLIAINHLEGHALTARLTENIEFPYLLLLVSGGHTQIVCVHGLGNYQRWGTTIDDALGEAFDKTAKLLSLPFPGGPSVERAAEAGDANRFAFPVPMRGHDSLNFSFSGLKTAVRQLAEKLVPISDQDVCDISAAFQQAAAGAVGDRLTRAMEKFEQNVKYDGAPKLIAAGGVAANAVLRERIETLCRQKGWAFYAPPLNLCGDNAAMIAWAGLERLEAGFAATPDFSARSRWPLDETSAPAIGHGRRGAKA